MNGLNKGINKVEFSVKWDPSPAGEPATDLDIVAATYLATETQGDPAYVVHFDSRSPDGTIYLNRDSKDGKGFGWDEVMTLELTRLDRQYARVVVGVAIQQRTGRTTFVGVHNPGLGSARATTSWPRAISAASWGRRPRGRRLRPRRLRRVDVPPGHPRLRRRPATFARLMGSPQES